MTPEDKIRVLRIYFCAPDRSEPTQPIAGCTNYFEIHTEANDYTRGMRDEHDRIMKMVNDVLDQ